MKFFFVGHIWDDDKKLKDPFGIRLGLSYNSYLPWEIRIMQINSSEIIQFEGLPSYTAYIISYILKKIIKYII